MPQSSAQARKRRQPPESVDCEVMYVSSAPHEHTEEYLEALWLICERSSGTARIGDIARLLNVAPPSVVEMLRRMEKSGYVKYRAREGVSLTEEGKQIGRRMVRNGRLIEVLMENKFKIKSDPRVSCGIEHHMTKDFADALCKMLDHPKFCPHGNPIPQGECCPSAG